MRTAVSMIVIPLLALAAPASAKTDGKAQVAGLIGQWANARVKGDTAFLERFYGAELRLNQMNGGIVERKDDIALFAARLIKPEFIHDVDVDIHLYGNTAVASWIENLRGSYRGGPVGELSLRMLNVLVRRDGRWQLVASQSTPIAK